MCPTQCVRVRAAWWKLGLNKKTDIGERYSVSMTGSLKYGGNFTTDRG